MASILNAVIGASSIAVNLVQNYLLAPYVAGVRIETKSYKEIMDNEVSEKVIINASQGKLFQTDNVAPKPERWEIQGYLAPSILEVSALSPILQPTLLLQKKKLREARLSREPITFVPLNREQLNNPLTGALMVAIEHLDFSTEPDTMNRVPVNITLKEIPVLYSDYVATGDESTPSGLTNAAASEVNLGSLAAQLGSFTIPVIE